LSGALRWPIGRGDIAQLPPAMDMFAPPSFAQGISNSILEAQASALPVVATRAGGNAEIVTEGVTAKLAPPADAAAPAAALREYVLDENGRRAAGAAARQLAVSRFSMEAMVRNYLQVYDAFLRAQPRSGSWTGTRLRCSPICRCEGASGFSEE
jgi:glycosyltransferase involved in cell wall biosynthesis